VSYETTTDTPRLYDGEGDLLLEADKRSDRVILLPSGDARHASTDRDRIRIQWGQHLLADLLAGRYRTVICGVNADDNSHGIIADLLNLVSTSQWTEQSATTYAKVFQDSTALHAANDREPFILKFDLDKLLILAILRPAGRDHFTLEDMRRGFATANRMLSDRRDRWPSASVSFLGAKSNRLLDEDGQEPTLESVLRVMFDAGYRGDVFPPLSTWQCAPTGVFATYPFPASLAVMRSGGF
jgi:hypothetical protein